MSDKRTTEGFQALCMVGRRLLGCSPPVSGYSRAGCLCAPDGSRQVCRQVGTGGDLEQDKGVLLGRTEWREVLAVCLKGCVL